jgi:hypothetical protein
MKEIWTKGSGWHKRCRGLPFRISILTGLYPMV